ncbi:MAG TPA: TIGR03617 family F420-dependent LLM class oxidoreductase, partial [Geminicoccaceae bacterium]|nr:TIGR03617 family F420-dependent LLM class oxidoreductase [Geminicoccaceae bacterium]
RGLGAAAAAYERLGVDGLWSYETAHDPFLPLFAAALATERVSLGTAIAVAFARTPFAMAQTAWDLQRVSNGRLLLGLGTQVRAHVERRFSAAFEHPAARIVDYVRCLRAIWDTFQNGTRPAYEGRFYRFTLISDFFNPGPIEHPAIPIALAGVGERMARAAGEVADGFHVHPLHSPGYLRDVLRPAVAEGARAAGRDPSQLQLIAPVFIVTGDTEAERKAAEAEARRQIAFYASTPTYRPFLAYHGFAALGKELSGLARAGRFAEMAARVPDALLEAVAVHAAPSALAEAIRARYDGDLVRRIYPYASIPADDPEGRLAALVAGIRSAAPAAAGGRAT